MLRDICSNNQNMLNNIFFSFYDSLNNHLNNSNPS